MKRILWVDDYEICCIAVCEYLQRHAVELGSESIEAMPIFSLQGALEEVNKHRPPDLVFLDLDLDEPNSGTGTLERFQAGNTAQVRVIVCTGLALTDGNVEILRKCLALGAGGILLKSGAYLKTLAGLRAILEGFVWVPEKVFGMVSAKSVAEASSTLHGEPGYAPTKLPPPPSTEDD